MYFSFLKPAGLGGGVEWKADHGVRTCRNVSAQYRWNTRGHLASFISVTLQNPRLILQTLWPSRLVPLWLTHCGCTWREPLHGGTKQGSDSHAAGSCSYFFFFFPLVAGLLFDISWCVGFLVLFKGNSKAAVDLFQGRRKPCASQCLSVLSGGGHGHSAHQSLWPF